MTEVIPRVSETGKLRELSHGLPIAGGGDHRQLPLEPRVVDLGAAVPAGAGHVDLPTDHVELVRRVLLLVERRRPGRAPRVARKVTWRSFGITATEGTGCRRARGPSSVGVRTSTATSSPRSSAIARRWRARPHRRCATSTVRRHCRSARTWRRRCGRAARRGRGGRPSGCGCGRSRSPRGASTRTRAPAEATAARERRGDAAVVGHRAGAGPGGVAARHAPSLCVWPAWALRRAPESRWGTRG